MDEARFDDVARTLAARLTRRRIGGALAALAAGALAPGAAGAASAACSPDEVRAGGRCVCRSTGRPAVGNDCPCPPGQGLTRCDGRCVDTKQDNLHCGACGTVCGDSAICRDGACLAIPVLTCTARTTFPIEGFEFEGFCGAIVGYTMPQVSGPSGTTVECDPPSGSLFPLGETTITCRATTPDGVQATCEHVTILVVDGNPPVLDCPADLAVDAEPAAEGAVVEFAAPLVTEVCSSASPPVCEPSSGSVFAVGTHTVTCFSTNEAGYVEFCSFGVTVSGD